MKQKSELKGTHYYFEEAYPKQILEKRRELQQQTDREKGTINLSYLITAMLLTAMTYCLENNTKRKLPISPENAAKTNMEKIYRQIKRIKSNKWDVPVKRSNSLSEGVLKQGKLNFVVTNPTNNNNTQNKQA